MTLPQVITIYVNKPVSYVNLLQAHGYLIFNIQKILHGAHV